MGTLKEFIAENSTTEAPKKKRRIRLKNFNPFRNRKYNTLNEDLNERHSDRQPRTSSSLDDNQNPPLPEHVSNKGKEAAAKRQRPKELLQAAKDRLGLTKGNQDDPNPGKKARKEGSTECLIEADFTTDDVTADPIKAGSLSKSGKDNSQNEQVRAKRPSLKRVVISGEIEVIETAIDEELKKKKKKSKKKKIKKAGIRTAKFLGHGVTNMALSLRYLTPHVALEPAISEIARQREQRYRDLSAAMAFAMT